MNADDASRESGHEQAHSQSDNFGIERSTFEHGAEPWKDPAILEKLYWMRGLSQGQIGDHFDIRQQTVCYWMDKLDVETEPPMHERNPSISRSVREDGKVQFLAPADDGDGDGESDRVHFYRHQMVALLATDADGDWEYVHTDIFGKNASLVVHHEMNSPVGVDVPANLSALTAREHVYAHAGGVGVSHVEAVLGGIFEDYDGEPDPEEWANPEEALDTEALENPLAAESDDEGPALDADVVAGD